MAAPVVMSHPATALKQSDGTYIVKIQHTVEGTISEVHFTNTFFAATLANAYAADLNGKAAVDAKIDAVIADAGPAIKDATDDIKRMLADAEKEAGEIVDAAKLEASELKIEAEAGIKEIKQEADKYVDDLKTAATKLYNEAKDEASKLLKEASEKLHPAPVATAPAAIAVEDDETPTKKA